MKGHIRTWGRMILATVCKDIEALIIWAEVDRQHALENDAPDTAWDDECRANMLRNALKMLEECKR
jgi:hypothetical protein